MVDGFEYLSIWFFVFGFMLLSVGMFILLGFADGFADCFACLLSYLSSHFWIMQINNYINSNILLQNKHADYDCRTKNI